MTCHLDDRLVVFLEHQRHTAERVVELRVQISTIQRERDAARHVQRDVVADARNAHTGSFELLPQLGFLHVHVIAHTAAGNGAHTSTDQRVLQLVAFRQQPCDCAGGRADTRTLRGLARLLFARVRIHRRAGRCKRQQHRRSTDCTPTSLHHSRFHHRLLKFDGRPASQDLTIVTQ